MNRGGIRLSSNPIDLSMLELPRWDPKTPKGGGYKEVVGFDTETLNGYAKLITDSNGRYLFSDQGNDYLDFLAYKGYRQTLNVFFNIRYDFQAIIKYLPLDNLKDLQATGKTEYNGYILTYIPKKLFNLRRDKNTYTFYDISQFYHSSLEAVGHKYLNREKYIEDIDRVRLGSEADYWEDREDQIRRYCINDSILTKEAGELLRDSVKDIIGIYPKRWTSQATISKYYFRYHCNIPSIKQIPKGVLNMALLSYSGGRFETIKKGYFKRGWNIDINSAYPYEIRELIDVTAGKWRKVSQPTGKGYYGFYLVKVNIPFMLIAPLPFRTKSGLIIYPIGTYYTYLTLREYEAYKDLIEIKPIYGVEFYPSEIIYPFREAINKVYSYKRSVDKTDFRYSVAKIVMNALYGSFYEKHKEGDKLKAGMLFNPIYATLITAHTRVKLYEAIRDRPEGVISFATDGILLEYEPKIPYDKELGSWDIEPEADITIIKTGVYRYGSKNRSRGVKKLGEVKTPYGSFKDLWSYIEKRPELNSYPILTNRPVQLGEIIVFDKLYSPEDLNSFKERVYNIDINKDLKRIWLDSFSNGGEVFTKVISSLPVDIS